MKMSRLPWMPSTPFDAKSESPTTTSAGLGLRCVGAGGASGFGQVQSVIGADTAEPMASGPGLSPAAASMVTSPVVEQRLDVGLGPASRTRLDEGLRRAPSVPAGARDRGSRQRVRGQDAEALGDRVRRVGRCDGDRGIGADQAAHAAGVHDDVVADLDVPLLRQRHEAGGVGAPIFDGGSSASRTLPALPR